MIGAVVATRSSPSPLPGFDLSGDFFSHGVPPSAPSFILKNQKALLGGGIASMLPPTRQRASFSKKSLGKIGGGRLMHATIEIVGRHDEDFVDERFPPLESSLGSQSAIFASSIYDGHGGREAAFVAWRTGMLTSVVLKSANIATAQSKLCTAFRALDATIFQTLDGAGGSCQTGQRGQSYRGTTATVVGVFPPALSGPHHPPAFQILVANVGDSEVVIFSPRGSARKLTVSHTCANEAEAERIARAGGLVANGRVDGELAVSRALGDFHLKRGGWVISEPNIAVDKLHEGEILVSASDGFWNGFSSLEHVHAELFESLHRSNDSFETSVAIERLARRAAIASLDDTTISVLYYPSTKKQAQACADSDYENEFEKSEKSGCSGAV